MFIKHLYVEKTRLYLVTTFDIFPISVQEVISLIYSTYQALLPAVLFLQQFVFAF